jgi:hypothetical protein
MNVVTIAYTNVHTVVFNVLIKFSEDDRFHPPQNCPPTAPLSLRRGVGGEVSPMPELGQDSILIWFLILSHRIAIAPHG